MRLGKKILILFAVAFACFIVGGFFAYNYSMSKVKKGLTYFHNEIVQGEGEVESLDLSYDHLRLQLPFGLKAENLQIDIHTSGSDHHVRVTAEAISAQLKGLLSGKLRGMAKNIDITSSNDAKRLLSNQFKIRNIEVQLVDYETYVSILEPDRSMRRVYKNITQLIRFGDTTGNFQMEGTVYFDFEENQLLPQRFHTVENGDVHRIVLNEDDLQFVAPKFASRLSDGDLKLVANHPLKAPRLLEIRRETEEKTLELRWGQQDFAEDAYRHVLWSYLLTKEYGKDFANQVTNAHEFGSYNTEEEMEKDRQNNQVGIAYAEEGIVESKILKRIRTDPRIQL